MEPVLGNIGPILPEKGYLEGVRRITKEHDVLLIFDEVITGFRLALAESGAFWHQAGSDDPRQDHRWRIR